MSLELITLTVLNGISKSLNCNSKTRKIGRVSVFFHTCSRRDPLRDRIHRVDPALTIGFEYPENPVGRHDELTWPSLFVFDPEKVKMKKDE
jgi:hypothetical protein